MNMKKLLYIATVISLIQIPFISCQDFLEKPPSQDITVDTVFSSAINVKKLLYTLYGSIPYKFPLEKKLTLHPATPWVVLASTTDEAENGQSTAATNLYNTGGLNAANVSGNTDYDYGTFYKAIRYCWNLIENIDRVPDLSEDDKKLYKAEARMIIATNYYELMIRLGGVPYIDHVLTATESWDYKRMPLNELVEKIDNLIKESMKDLPDKRENEIEEQGRLTKSFGYFLRARLYMSIARPLFNAEAPYLSMPNPSDNNLIWMGNYDRERYKKAADICKEAITYLEGQGFRLFLKTDTKSGTAKEAYLAASSLATHVNPEMVYYRQVTKKVTNFRDWSMKYIGPRVLGMGEIQPTESFKMKFQMSNGGPQTIENGYDPNSPYDNLDPRFYACFIYHGTEFGKWVFTQVFGENAAQAKMYDPEHRNNWNAGCATSERCATGYHSRKFLLEDCYRSNQAVDPITPYMRMAELYLMYAEALNEYNNGPDTECYTYLNKVRTRSDMPAAKDLDYQEMKKMIEYEWMVEFAFEGNRFFNLRQWKQGDILSEPIYGSRATRDASNPQIVRYNSFLLEERKFNDCFYLYPFPQDDVNMGYGLVQNPGW